MSMSVVEHQAYRRAWFSLLLYPLSFAAAFAVGEGLVSLYVHRVRLPAYLATALAAAFVLVNLLSDVVGRAAG
ncbi:MAG: hypothetical protein HYU55_12420 [Nocardioides sp.]|nr:hypothetical protein [Nocardioides sp.]